jgi:hypothetical protein
MGQSTSPQSNFPDHSKHLELFNLYRDYVRHQYDLINHRTTWYATMQAFLFGAFGFSIQKKAEVAGDHPDKLSACATAVNHITCNIVGQLDWAIIFFCVVGMAISCVVWRVMKAASDPIQELYRVWEPIANCEHAKGNAHVPYLTGGMDEKHANAGRKYTMWLPVIIGIIWLLILIVIEIVPFFSVGAYYKYVFV